MYHMVLNMSRISLDQALDQICMLVTGKPATMPAAGKKLIAIEKRVKRHILSRPASFFAPPRPASRHCAEMNC
jgi:hypothetical protein